MQRWLDLIAFQGGRFARDRTEPDEPPNDIGFRGNRNDQSNINFFLFTFLNIDWGIFSMLMKIYNGIALEDETYPPFIISNPIWAARKTVGGQRRKFHLPKIQSDKFKPTHTLFAIYQRVNLLYTWSWVINARRFFAIFIEKVRPCVYYPTFKLW